MSAILPLHTANPTKLASMEVAANFTAELTNLQTRELEGVSVHTGVHPVFGYAVVISPALGDHMIMLYPFENQRDS